MNIFRLYAKCSVLLLLFFLLGQDVYATSKKDSVANKITSVTYIKSKASLGFTSNYSSGFLPFSNFANLATNRVIGTSLFSDLYNLSNEDNSFLFEQASAFNYQHKLNNTSTISFGIGQRNFSKGTLDDNLLALVANGNTPYKGSTLEFTNSNFLFFNQNQLNISYQKLIKTNNLQIILKPTLHINETSTFINTSIKNSSLFTEENAEYLSLVYDYEYAVLTQSNSFAGIGASMSFSTNFLFKNGNEVELSINDFGLTRFKNSSFYTGDRNGNIDYDGIFLEYRELSNLGNNSVQTISDSLTQLIRPLTEENNYVFASPFRINLSSKLKLNEKGQLLANATYIPNYTVYPMLTAAYVHTLSTKLSAGLNLSNGAFGGTGIGFCSSISLNKLEIQASAQSLFNLRSDIVANTGLNLKLSYSI